MKKTSDDFSIQSAFEEAWELFVKKIGSLFAITTVTFLSQFALFIISLVVVASLVLGAGHVDVFHFETDMLQAIPMWVILTTIGFVIISFIASAIVNLIGVISMYLSVASTEGTLTHYARSSLRAILPLFVTQILVTLIIMGNMFAFIIPALVACYFLMFVTQVVIYEHKSAIQAMKRSTMLVSQNFGSLFVKLLIPFLIQAIVEGIFTSMMKQNPSTAAMLQLPHIVLSVVWGYYMFVYSYILYKHAITTTKEKPNWVLTWLTTGAIIGAVIISVLMYAGVSLLGSQKVQENFQKMTESAKDASGSATKVR